jgi:CBS domain containing-hemolysin-like protein
LLKITKLNATHQGEHFHSTDEIKLILSASRLHGELTADEADIIEHTLDLADITVTSVMRPQEGMAALDISQPIPKLSHTVLKYRYSRYPVYDKTRQNIIGIIHAKDLFAALYQQQTITDIKPLIRPVLKVSHQLPALDLLREFRDGVPHFALIYGNRDTLIGFVTLDNLLHVLLGRIKDEFHKTQDDWTLNADGSFTVQGNCSIYTVEQALDIDIVDVEIDESNTIAGLILNRLGALPEKNQRTEFQEFSVVIEKIAGTKIQEIKMYPKSKSMLLNK